MRAMDDTAFMQPALAGAACTVAAAIGQAYALADGRCEHRFVALDFEGVAAGLDGHFERHEATSCMKRRAVPGYALMAWWASNVPEAH